MAIFGELRPSAQGFDFQFTFTFTPPTNESSLSVTNSRCQLSQYPPTSPKLYPRWSIRPPFHHKPAMGNPRVISRPNLRSSLALLYSAMMVMSGQACFICKFHCAKWT